MATWRCAYCQWQIRTAESAKEHRTDTPRTVGTTKDFRLTTCAACHSPYPDSRSQGLYVADLSVHILDRPGETVSKRGIQWELQRADP